MISVWTELACRRWSRQILSSLLYLFAISLGACGARSGQEEVQVGAAASLRWIMPDLACGFEERTGISVSITFAASGTISQQIRNGAPIDLFCSADRKWVQQLVDEGHVKPGSVVTYALGELVLGFSAKRIEGSALAVLQERDFGSIGMANPDLAPYGRAAVEVLEALGIRNALKEKMVYGQNVGQVLTYLSRGEIESAFLPRTLADSQGCAYLEIPPTLYSPLEQVMVVPLSGLNPCGGREFAEYILGSEGRKILSRHGFALPDRRAADDS